MVTQSVRSGFHLLLSDLALPPGDEVIFSAITHPDMPRIAALHGLRALPADLDADTLAPDPEALERAVGPRTRMIVVAHLFGGRVDLAPLRAVADHAGALLVEDCAQALVDPADLRGSVADVSLFSFGTIKTATALGGGILQSDDAERVARLRSRQDVWPTQPRRQFARKAATGLLLTIVQRPRVFGGLAWTARRRGTDLDRALAAAVRGFPPMNDAALVDALEHRPSAPLVATISARLTGWAPARIERRALIGGLIGAGLAGESRPGHAALRPTHWLVPVAVPHPVTVASALRTAGFDVSHATTSIGPVTPPVDRPDLDPITARSLMERIIFVPAYPDLDDAAAAALASTLTAAVAGRQP